MAANNLPSRMTRRRPTTVGERAPGAVQPAAERPMSMVPPIEPAGTTTDEPRAVTPFRVATKPFPHRISLDVDEATYTWLRDYAHDARVPMGVVLRQILSSVRRDGVMLAGVTERIQAPRRPGTSAT